MPLGQTLITFNPSTTIRSADVNSNLASLNGASVFTSTSPLILATGSEETGFCGFEDGPITNGDFCGAAINFKTVLQNTLTSLTLTMVTASGFGTPSTANPGVYGCSIAAAATATAAQGWWFGRYVTVGNTIYAVDAPGRSTSLPGRRTKRGASKATGAAGVSGKLTDAGDATFIHHCGGCDLIREGLPIRHTGAGGAILLDLHRGDVPGLSSITLVCPQCGTIECLFTHLRAEHEAGWDTPGLPPRDQRVQAHYIRIIQAALGLARHD